jgi:GNAT superfamily N-acetyltransferase
MIFPENRWSAVSGRVGEGRVVDNDPAPELQLVIENLPAGFDALREEARAEGQLFVERLAADWAARRMRFDREGEALLAAHVAGVLAGIGGLTIEPVMPGALRMRRFYVRPLFRRAGIGRKLATALLERARTTGLLVTVNAAPASASFWESLGFAADTRDGHTHLYRGF